MKRILMLFLVIFLFGCGTQEVTINSDQGDVQVKATGFDNDDWCQTGAEWKMTADQGDTNAHWTIEGLMTSGKFEGLCHVVYTAVTPDGETKIDYYFSEDGESGYFEMNVNGQTFTQEWNK